MAGSYSHAVADDGQLLVNEQFVDMIENLGDAYEMAEEMYGMIWWLAGGDATQVERARQNYQEGIQHYSPGAEGRLSDG